MNKILKYKITILIIGMLLISLVIFKLISKDKWDYSLSPLEKGDKIIAFGDSLTYGYQLQREESYPSLLNQELNSDYNIVNYGINGNTTVDGLRRFQEMINIERPKLVILALGGNDVLRRISKETTIKNLNSMISIAKKNNVQVILLPNPEPSLSGFILGFNDYEIFKVISKDNKVPVLKNTFSKWLSKDNYKIDNIHLNKEGYYQVAKDIKKQLIENDVIKK